MSAEIDATLKKHRITGKPTKDEKKGIRQHIGKVRNTISKYVSFEKDAIFKDPNWPYY